MPSRAARVSAEVYAAVDLGSHSFYLLIARHGGGQTVVIERLREPVRLGAGVTDDGRIGEEAAARALACLERFGRRLRETGARNVRIVGTHAWRMARSGQMFHELARKALGHPVEIISGVEEARLIYAGVAHSLPGGAERRLVIDIGGGSTELIIGKGPAPQLLESVELGCVHLSERHFGDGGISAQRIAAARHEARQKLEPPREKFLARGWQRVIGTSGTVRAIMESVHELDPRSTAITPERLARLMHELECVDHISELQLDAVTEERGAIFPGGLVILAEIFATLGIKQLEFSRSALRDGVLQELIAPPLESRAAIG